MYLATIKEIPFNIYHPLPQTSCSQTARKPLIRIKLYWMASKSASSISEGTKNTSRASRYSVETAVCTCAS